MPAPQWLAGTGEYTNIMAHLYRALLVLLQV
jgi:hypothetical protein